MNSLQAPYIHLRINRNVSVAVLVSVLVHALLLYLLSRQDLLNQGQPPSAHRQTMVVRLNPKAVPPAEPPRQVLPPAPPPKPAPRPATKIPPSRPVAMPPVIATPKPQEPAIPLPEQPAQPAPPAPRPGAPDPSKFADMQSYLNAVREQRRLAGEDADRVNEEAIARERGPSEDEVRMANLRKNLQPPGTSGVFQILGMDNRSGQFAFRGWQGELSYSHREVYAVEAGPDGDVGRAMVRKMIEIIRRYYSGDFNWESPRFGRVIVLSARPQDNDGLEDFLMQEFFGTRRTPAR